jgi:hypothetical protein
LPHPSYDLDGDGIVGCKDYFLAKRFDLDQDGRLNTAEKANAIHALKSGFEDNFVWKVEQTGANRGKRLMQVRGKFIDAEDFLPIRDTYPQHPVSKVNAQVKTQAQLKDIRKAELVQSFKKTKEQWDKSNPSSMPQQYILSEFLVDHPAYSFAIITHSNRHTSVKQIRNEKIVAAREQIGLTTQIKDIKDESKDPSLKYVSNPEVKSKSEWKKKVKNDNLKDLSKFGVTKHAGETDRLKAREDCVISPIIYG